MSNKLALGIILSLSLLTRFIFFGHPNQVVFDEVHFGKFASGYYTHQYYFDIHPPLGKLIIAGFAKLFHFQPEFSFAEIGQKFPDKKYMALRFLPTLAAAFLPLVIYWLAKQLRLSTWGAFTAALLIICENAILTQSRYILLDSFLLLFGFTALLFYFRYWNNGSWRNLIGTAIFGGMAMSVKWTGLAFLALPAVVETYELIRDRNLHRIWRGVVFFAAIPGLLYFLIFAIHFKLLYKSGPGDAFMSIGFQKTLQGSMYADNDAQTPSLINKFLELNAQMYTSNQRLTATHAYGSQWYTWPFMLRPIYYWVDTNPAPSGTSDTGIVLHNTGKIYLLGNPLTWWLSTVAVFALLGYLLTGELRKSPIAWILIGGYVLNLLPFIGIHRVMFLYHYLTALIFALLILVYIIEATSEKPRNVYIALIVGAVAMFLYFAPLTYGLPLSPAAYQHRVWLKSWE